MSCQFAFALILGILLAECGGRQCFLPVVMLAVTVILQQLRQKNYRECILRGMLLLAAGTLGVGCQIRHDRVWDAEKQALLQGQQVCVCGTLVRKEQKGEGWQLILELPGYENRVIVSTEDGGYPLDCVLSVKGPIREFDLPRNEGQFNEKQYYKCRKIIGRIYAKETVCIRVPSGIRTWRECLYLLRTRLSAVYEACLPAQSAGIVSTMAVGEKALLDASVRNLFQKAGISHILAISGMHISMIGMGIYAFLRRCRCPYIWCSLATAVVLLLYGTMIGMGTASGRAIGMFSIYLLAQCLGQRYDTCAALAVLATLLLVDNPFLLFDVSFQFSFLAVFAVVTAKMVLPKKEDVGWNYRLLHPIAVSLLLQIFTLPLVAYYYYEVPLYALGFNLLLLPYLGVVLGFGLVGGCAGMFMLPLGQILLLPCRVVLSVYIRVCELTGRLPFSAVICGRPSEEKLWLYYGLLAALILVSGHVKKRQSVWRRIKKATCMVHGASGVPDKKIPGKDAVSGLGRVYGYYAGGAALLLALLIHVPVGGFEIDYLDVGQGDGSMLCTEDGVVCFIDGGSSDVSGVGTYRLLPFLKSKGIRRVNYWLLSHLDEDHVNGFYEVLEAGFQIDAVVVSVQMPENEAKEYLLGTLAQYGVPLITVNGGDVLQLQKADKLLPMDSDESVVLDTTKKVSGGILRFLSPDTTTPVFDVNGASIVCLYEDEHVRALWTGDIGKSQEEWLLEGTRLPRIDLYKVAHHGSKYSNSAEYLRTLSPRLSVISCGKNNRFGHPHQEMLERLEEIGVKVMRTDESGAIKVKLERGKVVISGYRRQE